MKLFQDIKNISQDAQNAVIAIGNFDGVHRGHQIILQKAKSIADDLGKPFGVLTFAPHPRRLFRPDDPPFRLTPFDVKIDRLRASGLDFVCSLGFDWDFASQSADGFIEEIVRNGLNPAHIIVGYDFCFGQLRKGKPEDFQAAGFETTIIQEIAEAGEKLSSSAVRQVLRTGDIKAANTILGWEWEMRGEIIKGDQRGRELGYPTANVKLGETVHPAYGIYATFVQIEGEDIWRPSATNIGIRPMFEVPVAQVESFIFDFDEEIYGKTLRVRPVKRLRGEAKFDSLDDLIAQMDKDCGQAKKILGEVS